MPLCWLTVCVSVCVHISGAMAPIVYQLGTYVVVTVARKRISAYKGENLTLRDVHTGSYSSWHRPATLKNKFAPLKLLQNHPLLLTRLEISLVYNNELTGQNPLTN